MLSLDSSYLLYLNVNYIAWWLLSTTFLKVRGSLHPLFKSWRDTSVRNTTQALVIREPPLGSSSVNCIIPPPPPPPLIVHLPTGASVYFSAFPMDLKAFCELRISRALSSSVNMSGIPFKGTVSRAELGFWWHKWIDLGQKACRDWFIFYIFYTLPQIYRAINTFLPVNAGLHWLNNVSC
jgi:hypothetical protein